MSYSTSLEICHPRTNPMKAEVNLAFSSPLQTLILADADFVHPLMNPNQKHLYKFCQNWPFKSMQCSENTVLCATVSFDGVHLSFCVLWKPCFCCDPFVVVGHLRVNSWFVYSCATVSPTHHPKEKHAARCFINQWAPGVPLWGKGRTVTNTLKIEVQYGIINWML